MMMNVIGSASSRSVEDCMPMLMRFAREEKPDAKRAKAMQSRKSRKAMPGIRAANLIACLTSAATFQSERIAPPSRRRGCANLIMQRYRKAIGAAGGGQTPDALECLTSPGRADCFAIALHY